MNRLCCPSAHRLFFNLRLPGSVEPAVSVQLGLSPDHLLEPLDIALLLLLPELAASPQSLCLLLRLPERIHRRFQFLFKPVHFFLLAAKLRLSVGAHQVNDPLLLGQFGLLRFLIILKLLFQQLFLLFVRSLQLLLAGVVLRPELFLHAFR